ncbi:MAG: hypothetical protein LIO50_03395, partial [Phascolarctobacterium sp.]|uniref:hypothetical protein n=1 Tax=Phascolarctobacterium sp. TaxID=2049039 RepID=UPI0025DE826B
VLQPGTFYKPSENTKKHRPENQVCAFLSNFLTSIDTAFFALSLFPGIDIHKSIHLLFIMKLATKKLITF